MKFTLRLLFSTHVLRVVDRKEMFIQGRHLGFISDLGIASHYLKDKNSVLIFRETILAVVLHTKY
jgi:hypothetical protein